MLKGKKKKKLEDTEPTSQKRRGLDAMPGASAHFVKKTAHSNMTTLRKLAV